MKKMWMSVAIVAVSLLAIQSAKAITVLADNFDHSPNGHTTQPPSNTGVIGTWLSTPPNVMVSADFNNTALGSLSGRYVNIDGGFQANPGYLQTTSTISTVGDQVHAEMYLRYMSGIYIAFGIPTDADAMAAATTANKPNSALLWLEFQRQSGSFTTELRAMNSSGSMVNLATTGNSLHTGNSLAHPFPVGQSFDKIEFDYTIGATSGVLTLNGVVFDGAVPLRNPGGAVDGMFFLEDQPILTNINYYFDDLLITVTPVPEPSSFGLLASGMTAMCVLRRRKATK